MEEEHRTFEQKPIMDEEYQQTSSLDNDAVPEHVSDSPVLLLQSGEQGVTTSPSQPPPLLSQPSEATVTFPSSGNTSASFSSSYMSQGVDLASLAPSEMASGFGGEMSHKCIKCNSSFSSPYQLTLHWQEEHRDNYKCKRCQRCFAKKHNLQRHNCVNACNICGQQFTRRYNLKLHMQIHGDGSKMYKCDYCGKSFTRRYTLLTHIRSHTGVKLFKCSICGKAFTRQHTLNLHLKRHVTKASFFCRKCYAVFTDAVSLQLHRETEHSKVKKAQTPQVSTTSQAIQSSSNVVFPNSNTSFIYGTENVGLPQSYNLGSYYHEGQHGEASQLQGKGSSSHANPEHRSFDDSTCRDNSLMLETSGHSSSLDKHHWFDDKDDGVDTSPRQLDPLPLQDNSAQQSSSSNIVTVVDSDEEAMKEEPASSNDPTDANQDSMHPDGNIGRGSELKEGNSTAVHEVEPAEETRRSLFPIDNSKREKRMGRSVHRPVRSAWKHGDKMVKETSEIRIDIVDPNSLEEINPLLTPPRSSDTSTPRLTHASSESGSPSTVSFLEMSPTYPNQQQTTGTKVSQGATSSSLEDKSGSSGRLPSQEQLSIRKSTSYHRGSKTQAPFQFGANNSDSSSSEMVHTQRSVLQMPQLTVKPDKDNDDNNTNWRCAHCGISFEESLMYVVHMGCHGQQDPFQCSMCGLVCSDRMAFTLHIIGGKHVRPKSQ